MVEYLDKNGDKLRKGFYRWEDAFSLFYFTGNYDASGLSEFNGIDRKEQKIYLQAHLTRRLTPLTKEEAGKKLEELKAETSWIEKRLKE